MKASSIAVYSSIPNSNNYNEILPLINLPVYPRSKERFVRLVKCLIERTTCLIVSLLRLFLEAEYPPRLISKEINNVLNAERAVANELTSVILLYLASIERVLNWVSPAHPEVRFSTAAEVKLFIPTSIVKLYKLTN